MDRELASAVFKRWNDGLPVAETTFHKAASALGINPDDALLEARFYTMLDVDLRKLASGGSIPGSSLVVYSAAAGQMPQSLVKTASVFHLNPLELALQKLASQRWVPDLNMLKLALMGPMTGGEDAGMGMMDPAQAAGQPMEGAGGPEGGQQAMPPQPGAQVQQAPGERYRPSPMAPAQTPPSAEGNMMELVEAARHPDQGAEAGMGPEMGGEAGMGPDGSSMGPEGGMGPEGTPSMGTGMGPEAPPPMPPEEKIMQVAPDTPPEVLPRYAEKLQELEQNVGMPIQDPGQVQKFIAQMKKDDNKRIDEAIKSMSAQQPFNSGAQQAPAQESPPEAPSPSSEAEKVASKVGPGLARSMKKVWGRYAELMKGGKKLSVSGNRASKTGIRPGNKIENYAPRAQMSGPAKKRNEAYKSLGTRAATGVVGAGALYGGAKAISGAGAEKTAKDYGYKGQPGEEKLERSRQLGRSEAAIGSIGGGLMGAMKGALGPKRVAELKLEKAQEELRRAKGLRPKKVRSAMSFGPPGRGKVPPKVPISFAGGWRGAGKGALVGAALGIPSAYIGGRLSHRIAYGKAKDKEKDAAASYGEEQKTAMAARIRRFNRIPELQAVLGRKSSRLSTIGQRAYAKKHGIAPLHKIVNPKPGSKRTHTKASPTVQKYLAAKKGLI